MRQRSLYQSIIAAALLLAGCGEVTRRTPDDTLVVVTDAVFRDLDPRFSLTSHDVKVSRLVAPGLTTADTESMEPALLLAESIEPVGELVWEATLRPGLHFSTGEPVTAEDVAYSYQSVLDPELGSLFRKGFEERFERVEAVDERRVRFYLREPLATLLSDLDFGVISKKAALAGGGIFRDGRVVGAGAYRVVSFSEEEVMLEASEHYAGEAPETPRIRMRTVRDASARALMLVGGSADFTQNSIRLDLVEHVAARKRIELVTGQSGILTYLIMHNEDPVLADLRVRQAIAHAIDRQTIIDSVLGGRAVLATGLLAPMHWAYNPDVPRYDYDPARAMQLLDEAGYPDPDGAGPAPRLTLSYKTSADPFRVSIARLLAAQLSRVGIELELRSFESGTFRADIKAGIYQLASMQTAPISEPDWYFAYFHSSRIPTEEDPHLLNRLRYADDRVDELTDRGRRVMDREERRVIYAEVQEILARELPVVPLWHENNVAVVNVEVDGYELLPNARYSGLPDVVKK